MERDRRPGRLPSASASDDPDARPKRVLVVDGEVLSRAWLAAVLLGHGFDVRAVDDGDQALGLVRAQHFDLVLLDIEMREGAGAWLYGQLRAEAALSSIPVVVMTNPSVGDRGLRALNRAMFQASDLPPPETCVEKPLDAYALGVMAWAALDRAAGR